MSNPFTYVSSIQRGKNHSFENGDGYSSFMVNRALSYHYDCVMPAQAMNERSWLDDSMQYDYLFNSIEKKNRPKKAWAKQIDDSDIELIMQVYGCNKKIAVEYAILLNKEGLQKLKDSLFRGGRDGKS